MTRLTRVTGKVFGGDATATGENPEIGQFGSALAGTYNGTTDVATIQNLPAWGQGWAGAVTPDTNFPSLPEMTGFGKVLSYQNNYLLQNGMAEWDSGTIYYINQFCRVGNKIYYSLTDENQGNDPESDTTNWASYKVDTSNLANVDLNNLSTTGQAVIDNKANISASNFNTTGTTYLSGIGMPSDRYKNLTLGASGAVYTVPANGYVYILNEGGTSWNKNAYMGYEVYETEDKTKDKKNIIFESTIHPAGDAGANIGMLFPILKDFYFRVNYLAANKLTFRFVYAEGAPSE